MRRAVLLAGVALAGCGGDDAEDGPARPATTTAAVERRDLVESEIATGTLGYADAGAIPAGSAGVLTRMREDGSVVRRGEWLYELDGERTGWLLYGSRPAWRDLHAGISDGEDVRQLERNLAALGYDPGTVDDDWSSSTTTAVVDFQEDRGLTEDGSLSRGEIHFRPGATRLGEARAQLGRAVGPGAEIQAAAGTRREVAVRLEADRQELARPGGRVVVEMPGGETERGRVAEIGTIAEAGSGDDSAARITVRVALDASGRALDQAPVDVLFERERARDALAVPVTALLAREGGGFAVELARGRLVPVRPGLFADGWVEVEGSLREGDRVVVPA